jgi:hypothetical protein
MTMVRILPPARVVPDPPARIAPDRPVRMDRPVRIAPSTSSAVDELDVLLRRLSALPAVDFVAACRMLAVLEEFVARLSDTERTQFSRLMYFTVHAISLQRGSR